MYTHYADPIRFAPLHLFLLSLALKKTIKLESRFAHALVVVFKHTRARPPSGAFPSIRGGKSCSRFRARSGVGAERTPTLVSGESAGRNTVAFFSRTLVDAKPTAKRSLSFPFTAPLHCPSAFWSPLLENAQRTRVAD